MVWAPLVIFAEAGNFACSIPPAEPGNLTTHLGMLSCAELLPEGTNDINWFKGSLALPSDVQCSKLSSWLCSHLHLCDLSELSLKLVQNSSHMRTSPWESVHCTQQASRRTNQSPPVCITPRAANSVSRKKLYKMRKRKISVILRCHVFRLL